MNAIVAIPTAADSNRISSAGTGIAHEPGARSLRLVTGYSHVALRESQIVAQQSHARAKLRILFLMTPQRFGNQHSRTGKKESHQGRDENNGQPVRTGLALRRDSLVDHLNDDRILGFVDAGRFQLLAEELVKRFVILQSRARRRYSSSACGKLTRGQLQIAVPGSPVLCSIFATWARKPASCCSARCSSGLSLVA